MVEAETLAQAREIQRALGARLQTAGADDSDAALLHQASALIEQLQQLTTTLDSQLATMRYLAQQRYRPKTEKVPPGQLALDLLGFLLQRREGDIQDNEGAAEPSSNAQDEKRARKKRKSGLHLLPVKPVERTLPESERICSCCGEVKGPFGFERRRHLVYEPAELYLEEEHLTKYACRKCGDGVVTAPGTPKLIEGSNVSSSVFSHLVVSKVIDTTPVERVGKQLARHGAEIAPSTLHD